MKHAPLPFLSLPLLALAACGGDVESSGSPTSKPIARAVERSTVAAVFAAEPIAPKVDNPVTPDKVALGNTLYHDTRMSKTNDISCASCHDLAKFGTDGDATSEGTGGQRGDRNAPTSLNAFRHIAQFWDGRAATVEEQALGPILNPIEHGMASEADVVAVLKKDEAIVAAFSKAFPGEADPVTFQNVGKAIGAFERTLVTVSPFEKWLEGDDSALDEAQKQGLQLFMQTGCTTCHLGAILGGNAYKVVGQVHPYETDDVGRFEVTEDEADKHVFKVPSLLNIEKTGPYFHDGSIKTLEKAVKLMAWHQLDKKVSDADVGSIVTFLKSLTGELKK